MTPCPDPPGYNPNVRSARLYGQISLDKTQTLQAGSSVAQKLYNTYMYPCTTYTYRYSESQLVQGCRAVTEIYSYRVGQVASGGTSWILGWVDFD